jgi:DNA-nicking Smr family endonuclease
MAKKKRDKEKREREPELPKFGGFKPFAGLAELKAKVEKEQEPAKGKSPAPAPPPPPKRAEIKEAPRTTSEADDELSFHRMMQGVTPLEAKAARVPATSSVPARVRISPAELKQRAEAEAEQVLEHLYHLVDDTARFEVTDDGRRVEGARGGASPAILRSLRRGLLPIDAKLDLHGLTEPEARDKLGQFLRDKRARGDRCVLVIHGKGDRTPGGGVLRGEIAAWLSQGRAREHVAAFATARDDDGGEGAVYVALRR